MARTARPSSAGMSPCAPPAITAAAIAMGSNSRPQPRLRSHWGTVRIQTLTRSAWIVASTNAPAPRPSTASAIRNIARLLGGRETEAGKQGHLHGGPPGAASAMGLGLPFAGGRHHAPFGLKVFKTGQRLAQDLRAFAEREPDLGAGRVLVVIEEGGGDGDDAGAFGQGAAELQGVPLAQRADVGGDEVRALRRGDLEADLGQARGEQVALGL